MRLEQAIKKNSVQEFKDIEHVVANRQGQLACARANIFSAVIKPNGGSTPWQIPEAIWLGTNLRLHLVSLLRVELQDLRVGEWNLKTENLKIDIPIYCFRRLCFRLRCAMKLRF